MLVGNDSFCQECANPNLVKAKTMEITPIAIEHPPFNCSSSEGCDQEPECDPSDDAEDQNELLALLEGQGTAEFAGFVSDQGDRIEVIAERNLLLFRAANCSDGVVGVYLLSEAAAYRSPQGKRRFERGRPAPPWKAAALCGLPLGGRAGQAKRSASVSGVGQSPNKDGCRLRSLCSLRRARHGGRARQPLNVIGQRVD